MIEDGKVDGPDENGSRADGFRVKVNSGYSNESKQVQASDRIQTFSHEF